MRSDRIARATAIAAALFTSIAGAQPTIYGATTHGADAESFFYEIDATTGIATPIGAGIGFERVSGMDFHPVTGELYAVAERHDGSDASVLITIDTATGAGTEVTLVNGGLPHPYCDTAYADISFRGSDSALYGYLEPCDGLGTIDVGTGALTDLGPTVSPSCCGNGMAFDDSDVLFHANEAVLNTLDQVAATATTVAPLDYSPLVNFPRANAMDFDPASATMYAAVNDGFRGSPSNRLATVNLATGVVTYIGPTVDNLDAIAVLGVLDADGDGVNDDVDACPDTSIPEASVPNRRLGTNRWALVDDDADFDTTAPTGQRKKGAPPKRSYTVADTAGCSCEQIIDALGLGKGHSKFGCSNSAMDDFIAIVNP